MIQHGADQTSAAMLRKAVGCIGLPNFLLTGKSRALEFAKEYSSMTVTMNKIIVVIIVVVA